MNVLLINPPIYDFSAYDFWAKPLGLLYLSSMLKQNNIDVSLLDCLDRSIESGKIRNFGCGKYREEYIEKPQIYQKVRRKYRRYGISKEKIEYYLNNIDKLSVPDNNKVISKINKPDIVMITSGMTYWYPGIFEIIRTVRKKYKNIPVILGGNYATLCYEHALDNSGADLVVKNQELSHLMKYIPGFKIPEDFSGFPLPDYSLYNNLSNAVLRLSAGCPFDCNYCASKLFAKSFVYKNPEVSFDELIYINKNYFVDDFAFYDDALLFNPEKIILPFLDLILKNKLALRFHTPNGLHTKFLSKDISAFMKKSNFINPRLSLETVLNKELEQVCRYQYLNDFENAYTNLINAGYNSMDIVVNIIFGLFKNDFDQIKQTINYLMEKKVRIYISEFSPIPGSKFWNDNKLDKIITDPLLTNNSIFPLHSQEEITGYQKIKTSVNNYNYLLRSFI